MLDKTKGIVLKSVNYRDNSCIVHIYTELHGAQSYIVNGVRNQKGAIKPSHIMPLNLVDLVVYHKENQDIHRIKELKCNPILKKVHFDITRNSIALFITEILDACVKESESNPALFSFLSHFVQILDLEDEGIGNYPIAFLLQLSKYLGFYPDTNYQEGYSLQFLNGCFAPVELAEGRTMTKRDSRLCYEFIKTKDWYKIKMSREDRSSLLNEMIEFYGFHALNGRTIKSHLILREVL